MSVEGQLIQRRVMRVLRRPARKDPADGQGLLRAQAGSVECDAGAETAVDQHLVVRDRREAARRGGASFNGVDMRVGAAALAHGHGRMKHHLHSLERHKHRDVAGCKRHHGPWPRRDLRIEYACMKAARARFTTRKSQALYTEVVLLFPVALRAVPSLRLRRYVLGQRIRRQGCLRPGCRASHESRNAQALVPASSATLGACVSRKNQCLASMWAARRKRRNKLSTVECGSEKVCATERLSEGQETWGAAAALVQPELASAVLQLARVKLARGTC
jgi:hypothetical protein